MEKVFFENAVKERLAGVLDGEGECGVIVCHGFTANKEQPLVRYLAEGLGRIGFRVLRFDFSGSGESEGDFSTADYAKESGDLKSAIRFMRDKGCKRIGLVGHSMGGAIALLVAADDSVDALATIAAPALPSADELERIAHQYAGRHIAQSFVENVLATNILDSVARVHAPVLFVHGTADTLISPHDARELFAHAHDPKDLRLIENADHLFTNTHERVFEEVSVWMKRYLMS